MNPRLAGSLVVAVIIGLAVGVGGYTFVYAKGASYLANDPGTCVNCHIMREHFDGWVKSSHRSVAACNDCHTPHSLVGKYVTKASNGFWHSFAFTTGHFADPIQIKAHNREVTERACRNCHQDTVIAMAPGHGDAVESCVRCHAEVGHGR